MYGILSGFEIGKRALLSQQFGLNVTGHNIANVNTPGFSRQRAIINTTYPQLSIKGALGTGVDVAGVSRYRDIFYIARKTRIWDAGLLCNGLSNSWRRCLMSVRIKD